MPIPAPFCVTFCFPVQGHAPSIQGPREVRHTQHSPPRTAAAGEEERIHADGGAPPHIAGHGRREAQHTSQHGAERSNKRPCLGYETCTVGAADGTVGRQRRREGQVGRTVFEERHRQGRVRFGAGD